MQEENKNCIYINKNDLGSLYLELGKGIEGKVYKYSENKAIKIFDKSEDFDLNSVIERIQYFSKIKIENFAFSQDLVCDEYEEIIGYTMPLIETNKYGSFFNLIECENNDEFINYFLEANKAMKELHKNEIYIGDFNPNNIMIDKNNHPIFIDTINYASSKFSFLLYPYNSMMYENVFGKRCSLLDNDKFMFALLFLSYFVSIEELEKAFSNPEYFKEIINRFQISESAKDILNKIFSVSENKDYLDLVLEEFKKVEHKKYDNKFYKIVKLIFK